MDQIYPKADHTTQWFANAYPGSLIHGNVLVVHTTETGSWPGYSGGAVAPNWTVRPNVTTKRLEYRQHFPANQSSRGLVNLPGGVETNTLNAFQVELVGTCSADFAKKYGYFYWPDAPDWALRDLAEFVNWLKNLGTGFVIKDGAPRGWLPYPNSYGNTNGQRMTFAEWTNSRGIVGHQHVPENDHGDPGAFPVARLVALAQPPVVAPPVATTPSTPAVKPPAPVTKVPNPTVTKNPTPIQKIRAALREIRLNTQGLARQQQIDDALQVLPKA